MQAAEQLESAGTSEVAKKTEVPYRVWSSPSNRYIAIAHRIGLTQKIMMQAGAQGATASAARTRVSVVDLRDMKVWSYSFLGQNVALSFSDDSGFILGLSIQRRFDENRQSTPVISRFGIRLGHRAAALVADGAELESLIEKNRVAAVSDGFRTLERMFLGHSGSMSGDGKVIAFRNCVYDGRAKVKRWCAESEAWLVVDGTGTRVASSMGHIHDALDGKVLWTSRVASGRENIPVLSADSAHVAWVPVVYQTGWEMVINRNTPISPGSVSVERLSDGKSIAKIDEPWIFSASFSRKGNAFLISRYSKNGSIVHLDLGTGRSRRIEQLGEGFLNSAEILIDDQEAKLFVSAASGGDVIFAREGRGVVGTLLVDGEAMLAYLPDARFFANSRAFSDAMTYSSKGAEFTFSQLWDVFYDPTVIRGIFMNRGVERDLAGELLSSFLKNLPPRVSIGQGVPQVVGARRLRIPYSISADVGGIAEVRVFQNGKLIRSDGTYKDAIARTYVPVDTSSAEAAAYAGRRNLTLIDELPASGVGAAALPAAALRDQLIVRGAPEKKCDPCGEEIEVDVIPGEENTITVVAFNRDNTIQSLPASVTFTSTLPKEVPRLWVLSVGINEFRKYGTRRVGSLVNARKDAQDFVCTYAGAQALMGLRLPCGEAGQAKTLFKPENIQVVDALLDDRATKGGVMGALEQIAQKAKPGDTFIWFVASHGLMDANSLFGIVAHDTQCIDQACTQVQGHITSNEILEASRKIKAMKQLVVLDTCHAGGLDHKLSGLYDARVSLLARNMGLHLYASAQATEKAQDGKPGTNGTFTEQLLKGIRGAAPRNAEGQISMITLGAYARQQTIAATSLGANDKSDEAAQSPVIQHFGQDAGLIRID